MSVRSAPPPPRRSTSVRTRAATSSSQTASSARPDRSSLPTVVVHALVRMVLRTVILLARVVRYAVLAARDAFTNAPADAGPRSERSATTPPSTVEWDDAERAQRRQRSIQHERIRARRRQLVLRRLRLVALMLGIALICVSVYAVPRMSVFNVKRIAVEGTSAVPDLTVRKKVDPIIDHATIFTLDTSRIRSSLASLPFVRSVSVDRHFPNGLSVKVVEYKPLALGVSVGHGSWLVARDGRVLAKVQSSDWSAQIPKVVIEQDNLKPGTRLTGEPALRLLRLVPPTFPGTFETIEVFTPTARRPGSRRAAREQASRSSLLLAGTESIIAHMSDGTEIRFGRPDRLDQKLAVVERMLGLYGPGRRDGITYIDVSVPSRPAVMGGE